MANDYKKLPGSGSTNGKAVLVAATGTPGTLIHTADVDNGGLIYDEIWCYAFNSDTALRVLTIEFGGATAPDQNIKISLPSQSGVQLIVPGFPLNNGLTVKAFADATNKVTLYCFVNKITHS